MTRSLVVVEHVHCPDKQQSEANVFFCTIEQAVSVITILQILPKHYSNKRFPSKKFFSTTRFYHTNKRFYWLSFLLDQILFRIIRTQVHPLSDLTKKVITKFLQISCGKTKR